MDLLQRFQEFISKENLFSPKDRLLLAVSGGLDSVVLCELCHRSGFDFVIAHCNFQLRGEESERDEAFVLSLEKKYNKKVLLKRFNAEEYAAVNKVSIQVAARELRYAWFDSIVNGQSSIGNMIDHSPLPIHILTAHHLDDNIETLLMNFFRGTGIAGLRGMLPKQGKIVRPLLFAGKEELKAFAEASQLQWVEDSSNELDKYTRNYFRHQLIPLVEKMYPAVKANLGDNIERFRDLEQLYRQSVIRHKKKLLEQKGNEIHIPVLKLKKTEPLRTIVYEIIREFGFSAMQVEELIDLLGSGSGKYIQSASHRILKNRDWLIISPNNTALAGNILIEAGMNNVQYAMGGLHIGLVGNTNFNPQAKNSIAQLNADEIKFPLLLRKWAPGDYFYPLGMRKKKKIARFLIDQKLAQTEKEKVWVLEMDKKIIWVIGMRIDERFKVTPNTKQILKIEAGMAELAEK